MCNHVIYGVYLLTSHLQSANVNIATLWEHEELEFIAKALEVTGFFCVKENLEIKSRKEVKSKG